MTTEEGAEYLRSKGFNAAIRVWGPGTTIMILHGPREVINVVKLSDGSDVPVYSYADINYIYNNNGKWWRMTRYTGVTEEDAPDSLAWDTLEEAVKGFSEIYSPEVHVHVTNR